MQMLTVIINLFNPSSAIGLAIENDEGVSKRQAQSYNLHLKPVPGGVKGNYIRLAYNFLSYSYYNCMNFIIAVHFLGNKA